ncbi:MAG: tryptophan synthase subunit alpha, partial [Lysinibacillus sp.]
GERALAYGVTLRNVLAELNHFADNISVPLVMMTYLNPILAYGIENFAQDASAAGIRGLIVPDMPFEESELLHPALKMHGIALVQLISLTSPLERVKKLAAASEGFIYAVTVNGTTGVRAEFAENLPAHFNLLKQHSKVPVLAGFGISTPEHVKDFSAFADGVIVGSQIVAALEKQDWMTIESLVLASKKVGIL